MCFIYFLGYLDQQTLNYANAYGLKADLGLVGRDYSWVASITNIGYLVCAYPSMLLLQKLPIGKFVAGNLMLWGAILLLTTTAHNFAGIMALRFVLEVPRLASALLGCFLQVCSGRERSSLSECVSSVCDIRN